MKVYVLISIFLLACAALAQPDLSSKVIFAADHPIHGLQRAFEELGRVFQFTDEARARYALDLAERRLAEAQELSRRVIDPATVSQRDARISELSTDYAEEISRVETFGQQISDLAKQRDVQALVQAATSIHIQVLTEVKVRVPTQAQPAIDEVIQQASTTKTLAADCITQIDQMSSGQGESAARVPTTVPVVP